jgi:hypothetical protein
VHWTPHPGALMALREKGLERSSAIHNLASIIAENRLVIKYR